MTWKAVGAVAIIFLAIPASLTAQERPSSTLSVRIYNNVGIDMDDLRLATHEAETILQSAGINVAWIECWYRDSEPANAPDACRRPPAGTELNLRLPISTSAASTKVVSMGYSLVALQDRAPFLATIYFDRVTSVAGSAKVDVRLLLGRAIAHEIGHLLLNTTRHADAGLMREKWSQVELQKNNPSDWEFREEDTHIMKAAVSARQTARRSDEAW